jgi:hypothetical protein
MTPAQDNFPVTLQCLGLKRFYQDCERYDRHNDDFVNQRLHGAA